MRSTPAIAERTEHGAAPLLSLRNLGVTFATAHGALVAVREVTLSVASGECLGVVGESGAGKSQLFLAVMGLLAANGRVTGSARLGAAELIGARGHALDGVRGSQVGMVFQDPMTSLTPHLTIGSQLTEVVQRHCALGRTAARERARELLERVHVSDAARCLRQYPHELSGGMRQRAMIAIALAGEPRLLIADEPTTSLDVTIQAQILALLAQITRARGLALVLITHDIAALAGVADRVVVMRHGQVVEVGPVREILKAPRDPYTRTLLQQSALPPLAQLPPTAQLPAETNATRPANGPLLDVHDLSVDYSLRSGWLAPVLHLSAVKSVSLELHPGESLGIVGESGSGKSSLARAVLRLLDASGGRVVWMGRELASLAARELRALRRDLQIIFQDPLGSLDPRMTVAEIIEEPLLVHERSLDALARRRAVEAALSGVGLAAALAGRYPHELSGGQAQRVGIARAMVLAPRLLVCDEPVSALDAPTQQQIVALLATLRRSQGLSLLFISHNLAIVRELCDRVLVLYLGHRVELAPAAQLFAAPRHPYSRELLAAIPVADPDLQRSRLATVRFGEPPSPLSPPSGCVYRTRCAQAASRCAERFPDWEEEGGHGIACHRWRELA